MTLLSLTVLVAVASPYPGIVYQQAQEDDVHQQEQYAGYEQQQAAEEGHELQGISALQNKGYDIGQEHHVALHGKGYDLGEDHHVVDYYVSGNRNNKNN